MESTQVTIDIEVNGVEDLEKVREELEKIDELSETLEKLNDLAKSLNIGEEEDATSDNDLEDPFPNDLDPRPEPHRRFYVENGEGDLFSFSAEENNQIFDEIEDEFDVSLGDTK